MFHFFYLARLKTLGGLILYKLNEYIHYLLVFLLALTIIYNEWFIYSLYASKWPYLYCGNEKFCKNILLVADPQILGEERENILSRWDSDRYLFNTYGRALQHVKPDNVVFLGDLFDEGSIADQKTFERYLYRFCKIFFLKTTVPLASKNVIFIPGDNDIGGEEEIVIREKVDRFHLYFGSPGIIVNENIEFTMVNQLIDSMPMNNNPTNRTNTIKIMFSHIPLTPKYTKFTEKVLNEFKSEYIFSAHDHSSINFVSNFKQKKQKYVQRLGRNSYSQMTEAQWRFGQQSPDIVSEIIVPTCSYRMGSNNVGYGVLTIDTFRHSITYTILWLPSRFSCLYVYLYILMLSIILYLLHLITRNSKAIVYRVM
uniref:Metallophosphoesterase 1 n=1 Tax=Sipha flava TaxID=143950 RepID=A0A2S2R8C9_9HEMI